MTQSKYLVLICALFFLCQGCEEDFGILQIVPLAIDNNRINTDSTFYGQDSLYVSTHTHSVLGKRVILHKNNTVEVFLTSWGPLCLELDGLYSYGINEDETSPKQYNLKRPVILLRKPSTIEELLFCCFSRTDHLVYKTLLAEGAAA